MIDTPISETGFIGAAVGAAVNGLRPIAELMFVDFFGVCMDQIYNNMAKIHYFSGGNVKVPMVLMTAIGGGYSDAGQHSQTLWGTFAHLPGMKVVVPSNPYDAKGLMTSAIRDDNPVLYMFHKGVLGLGWMTNNLPLPSVRPDHITAKVVSAAAKALAEHPDLNGTRDGDVFTPADTPHISVAIQTEQGFVSPVVHDPAAKPESTEVGVSGCWD